MTATRLNCTIGATVSAAGFTSTERAMLDSRGEAIAPTLWFERDAMQPTFAYFDFATKKMVALKYGSVHEPSIAETFAMRPATELEKARVKVNATGAVLVDGKEVSHLNQSGVVGDRIFALAPVGLTSATPRDKWLIYVFEIIQSSKSISLAGVLPCPVLND
jgi:hypothetical protein